MSVSETHGFDDQKELITRPCDALSAFIEIDRAAQRRRGPGAIQPPAAVRDIIPRLG